ncbi:MAG: Trm112 family protein [Acidobacteriota bacterium]
MSLDPDLLDILVCPKSHGELRRVELPEHLRSMLIEKYREHFRDEEPVVTEGLLCEESQLLYPIVSDIPILLEDEALAAASLEPSDAATT